MNANSSVDPGEGQAGVVVYNDANNNQTFDGFAATKGTALPMFIPDAPQKTTNNSVAVTGVIGTIVDVNVAMNLTHTWDADLDIFLVSPAGKLVELSTDNGGSGDNYGSGNNDCTGTPTIFDDAAATSIVGQPAPFAGTFKPEGQLSNLLSDSAAGTWKLRITDDFGADVGTVYCFSMDIVRKP